MTSHPACFPVIALLDQMHWNDAVTETPAVGTTEVWELLNTTGDGHPIHVHLVQFQVLNRQPFDTYLGTGQLVFAGSPQPPDPNESSTWLCLKPSTTFACPQFPSAPSKSR